MPDTVSCAPDVSRGPATPRVPSSARRAAGVLCRSSVHEISSSVHEAPPPLLPRLPLSLPPPPPRLSSHPWLSPPGSAPPPPFPGSLSPSLPHPPRLSSHPRQGLARGGGYGHSNTDVCRSQRPAGHITGGGTGGGGQQPGHPTNKRATGEGEKGGGRRPGCRQGPARSACGDGGSIRRAQGGYWNARGTDGNRLTLRSRHQRL